MVELGQLEKSHAEFKERGVTVYAISNNDLATSKLTQADFPNLVVVSDEELIVAKAMQVVHPGADPKGSDTSAPTTFLVDGSGHVRWLFRPDRFFERASPDRLLEAIDAKLPRK